MKNELHLIHHFLKRKFCNFNSKATFYKLKHQGPKIFQNLLENSRLINDSNQLTKDFV